MKRWLNDWWPMLVVFGGLALVIYAMAHSPLT
jgi:hypothetical protein